MAADLPRELKSDQVEVKSKKRKKVRKVAPFVEDDNDDRSQSHFKVNENSSKSMSPSKKVTKKRFVAHFNMSDLPSPGRRVEKNEVDSRSVNNQENSTIDAKADIADIANTTFDVKKEAEERETMPKIENVDPIPIDESIMKPWRMNMKKQSDGDEKASKLPTEETPAPDNIKEEKPWRKNMKKSVSVESQPSKYLVVILVWASILVNSSSAV